MEILHGKSAVLASFHNETIIGARYLKMLQEDDLPVLQTIKAFNQSQFVCQKDGVLPHFFKPTWEWLNIHFEGRWIGR